mmetsp:Transcript_23439/g.61377  ORF Transcript_23439/g.61377 Transcript_23439/m.61377 type:complete len:370 (+) Transcript_23439:438-1547(+)
MADGAATAAAPVPPEAAAAPVVKFKKKKKKGTVRSAKPREVDTLGISTTAEGGGAIVSATDGDEGESISSILAATREEQHYRQRSKGISTITLATGQKVSKEEEVELASTAGGWAAGSVGLQPTGGAAADRDRDRTGEDSSVVKGLSNVFTGTQNIDFQDAEMKRYVDEQMMLRSGQPEEETDTRTDYEKRRQELFEVPEEYRAIQAKGNLKDAQSRGLLSNALLSGIPEVDLGVESKFKNVQRVEEERLRRAAGVASGRKPGLKDPVPVAHGDGVLNYGRARFLTSSVRDKRAMGSSKGVVDVPGQELTDHTTAFEQAKKQAFDRGVVDSATYSAHPAKVARSRRGGPHDGASDDKAVHHFRKKSRRF